MYAPPKLASTDLDDLVSAAGGTAAALRLLDITSRTMRRWRAGTQPVPTMALRLLWYASWRGRQSAETDMYNELVSLRAVIGAMGAALSEGARSRGACSNGKCVLHHLHPAAGAVPAGDFLP